MILRHLRQGLTLGALTLLCGCTSTTSHHQPYAQPTIVQTTPVATAPLAQPAPIPVQVGSPPPTVILPGAPGAPPCPNCAPVPPPPAPVLPRQ